MKYFVVYILSLHRNLPAAIFRRPKNYEHIYALNAPVPSYYHIAARMDRKRYQDVEDCWCLCACYVTFCFLNSLKCCDVLDNMRTCLDVMGICVYQRTWAYIQITHVVGNRQMTSYAKCR